MTEKFSTKERKKEFDNIYKQKILPFLAQEGFRQVTKTSKRVYKEFNNGLSVYIYFEFINFGSGFYKINIVYFDDELGKEIDDGMYFAAVQMKKPEIRGKNDVELNVSTENWIEEMKLTIMGFINQHVDREALVNSKDIVLSKAAEEFLQRTTKK